MTLDDEYVEFLEESVVLELFQDANAASARSPERSEIVSYLDAERRVAPLPERCPDGTDFRLWARTLLVIQTIRKAFARQHVACGERHSAAVHARARGMRPGS